MYSINNMSHIAKLITKTRYGATHSRFIYRISESLRNDSFNPAELDMLREFKYAAMLFYRASQEWQSENGYPLTLLYTVMWLENFRLIQLSRNETLMNGDVGICLGKSKKRFVTILQNEFYLSTSNTNFAPLTLETYNKFISLINGTTPYGERLFTFDDFYPGKKNIHNDFIDVSLKSIIWVHENALIKNTLTPMVAGRLTGYSQRFNLFQHNKWTQLGLDTNNNKNFLRDLIYFKSGLMPCQHEEMKKTIERTQEYLRNYLPSRSGHDELLLRRKRENQINRLCYGVRQRAQTPTERIIRNVNTVLSQTRSSRSIHMNTII